MEGRAIDENDRSDVVVESDIRMLRMWNVFIIQGANVASCPKILEFLSFQSELEQH